eukprot:7383995-Prymnesium_polylepis.1
MSLFSHWNGCIQFLLASIENFPSDSWVVRAGLENKEVCPLASTLVASVNLAATYSHVSSYRSQPLVQWSWSFFHANCQMLAIAWGGMLQHLVPHCAFALSSIHDTDGGSRARSRRAEANR